MKALFGYGESSEAGSIWKKWVTENGYLGQHLWLASSYFTISLLPCHHDVNCSVQLGLTCMADTSGNVHQDWLIFPWFHARYLAVIKSWVPLFPSWTFIWALAQYRMVLIHEIPSNLNYLVHTSPIEFKANSLRKANIISVLSVSYQGGSSVLPYSYMYREVRTMKASYGS